MKTPEFELRYEHLKKDFDNIERIIIDMEKYSDLSKYKSLFDCRMVILGKLQELVYNAHEEGQFL